jgi:hypothetical protein
MHSVGCFALRLGVPSLPVFFSTAYLPARSRCPPPGHMRTFRNLVRNRSFITARSFFFFGANTKHRWWAGKFGRYLSLVRKNATESGQKILIPLATTASVAPILRTIFWLLIFVCMTGFWVTAVCMTIGGLHDHRKDLPMLGEVPVKRRALPCA